MKSPPFAYARARDVAHAITLWSEAGPDARLLAGGQSLMPGLALRLTDVPALIDINHLDELRGITEAGDALRIGALTRHAELARNELIARYAPALAQAAPLIAHPAIRTRGTIGGSIAYADPAAELPACIVALDAAVVARGEDGERRIPAAEFFLGLYETALEEFEMIVAIEVPKLGRGRRHIVTELARRSGDYAIAGLVLAADIDGDRLGDTRAVFFGVGDAPVLASGAMDALDAGAGIDAACAALDQDLDPAADLQGGPEMKRHLARVLLRRAVDSLVASPAAA
jgi:aerobic carbon-monoxide dehydrogenase medium subunit